jgi:hypothetical protein
MEKWKLSNQNVLTRSNIPNAWKRRKSDWGRIIQEFAEFIVVGLLKNGEL